MSHVALLGDSILDNHAYVAPDPDVAAQLRDRLGSGWDVTLCAVDGHVTDDVREHQLRHVPSGASHLFISAGGNDALGHASVLGQRVATAGEAVGLLAHAQAGFAASYVQTIDAVLRLGLPTALCTIYDTNYPDPERTLVIAALALFNDVITRTAFSRKLPLIDLRLICNERSDFANPIEPSATGGGKIAKAIAELVTGAEGSRSTIWA